MSILNNFYRNYLSWRPNYYYLKMMETVGIDPGKMKKYFIMLKYLKNYKQCSNSTLKCNLMTGCEISGAAVGFALFSQSNKRCTNETLQPAHAGTKVRNIYVA